MKEDPIKYLQSIINSVQHPFYVVDVNNYQVVFANKACGFGELNENSKCYELTHHSSTPCASPHICPLSELKKLKQPVKTEHVHFDSQGNQRIMEVHGDPVFDDNGKLIYMIEYSFDITDFKKMQEGLQDKLGQLEKFNKVMLGREQRVIELKAEINNLLKKIGEPPKYFTP
ncbi:MAG: PAS domain-containing protein [Candidatus Omnitrophica bacterium]|nr:PAS domain-containing protein [Candidatus Omnitrophota bacterium]